MKLSSEEREQLCRILGLGPEVDKKTRNEQIRRWLGSVSEAATEEYVRMALGQRVFTRGQDFREYRLLLLVKYHFGGRLPTEQEVCSLFQTTATQSRALLRAVMSKYQYELNDEISGTIAGILNGASFDDGKWSFTVDSESVVEALNRRLAALDGLLPPVVRRSGTVATFEMEPSSYKRLTEK